MSYDLEGMKKRVQETRSGGVFWRVPTGSTKIRVLPGTVGNCDEGAFFRTIASHNIKVGDTLKRVRVRPESEWCPARAAITILRTQGVSDKAKELSPRTQFAMNICPHGTSDVMVWTCSGAQIEKMVALMADEDWGDFTDPNEGYCLAITKTGEGIGTRYDVTPSRTQGKLPEFWEENAHDLSTVGGEEVGINELIGILSEWSSKFYDDLASELAADRDAWTAQQQKRMKK